MSLLIVLHRGIQKINYKHDINHESYGDSNHVSNGGNQDERLWRFGNYYTL